MAGAWISAQAGKVDFLYRNIDQVARTIDRAQQGIYEHDYNQQPTLASQRHLLGRPKCVFRFVDPRGWIAGLRSKVEQYPPKLKSAVVTTSFGVPSSLSVCRGHARRGDVYNTVGCLTRMRLPGRRPYSLLNDILP